MSTKQFSLLVASIDSFVTMPFRMPTKPFHKPCKYIHSFVTMPFRMPTKPRSYYSNMIFVHLTSQYLRLANRTGVKSTHYLLFVRTHRILLSETHLFLMCFYTYYNMYYLIVNDYFKTFYYFSSINSALVSFIPISAHSSIVLKTSLLKGYFSSVKSGSELIPL